VASGDCGAYADETFGDLSVSYPATDPWAVAVGGTTLSVDGQSQRADEVACGVDNTYSKNARQVPDVAAVADNLAVYFQGAWGAVGGTSAAAPIWAAGQALVNEDTMQRLGTFGYAPRLYYAVADKHAGGNAYFD